MSGPGASGGARRRGWSAEALLAPRPDAGDLDLRTSRIVALVAGVAIVVLGELQRLTPPAFVDSVPLRAAVVGLCLGFVPATYASERVRRHARAFAYAIYVAVTLFSTYIVFLNDFAADTLIGELLAFAAISIAIRSPRLLLAYVALTVAISVSIVVAARGNQMESGSLLASALGFGAISYLLQRSRREVELRLAFSEQRFRSLVEDSLDVITLLAPDGTILYESPSVVRALGYTAAERVGTSVLGYLHPDDVPAAERALRDPTTGPLEVRSRHEDGSWRVFQFRPHPAVVEGEVASILVNTTDLTDRKRAEDEREALIEDLRRALARVKQLSGLLPICAQCKRTRNDLGYWEQLDAYLAKHSELEISHGLCPDCALELYGPPPIR